MVRGGLSRCWAREPRGERGTASVVVPGLDRSVGRIPEPPSDPQVAGVRGAQRIRDPRTTAEVLVGVREGSRKYVYSASRGQEGVHDLRHDPDETNDLAAQDGAFCRRQRIAGLDRLRGVPARADRASRPGWRRCESVSVEGPVGEGARTSPQSVRQAETALRTTAGLHPPCNRQVPTSLRHAAVVPIRSRRRDPTSPRATKPPGAPIGAFPGGLRVRFVLYGAIEDQSL